MSPLEHDDAQSPAALLALPTLDEPYLIAEEFCGGCGESIGFDVQPLTLRCSLCSLIEEDTDA